MSDEDPLDLFAAAASSSSSAANELFLAGFVIADIVGLRHYSGTISGRELVGLVRQPLNPHDPNALMVLNTRHDQVGYIERSAAATLSPLVDSGVATLEGIVPKPPKHRNPFKLPCQIHIFTPFDSISSVQSSVSSAGLHLISPTDPSFALSQSIAVQDSHPDADAAVDLDKIFVSVASADTAHSNRKIADPPADVVASELFLHQKEALAWLIQRENSSDLPPFWDVADDGRYLNVLTNYRTTHRPKPLRGGILADEMGLGKTLTLLSLIAANRPGQLAPPIVEVEDDGGGFESIAGGEAARAKLLRADGSQVERSGGRASSRKKRKINDRDGEELGPRTTLVVCPPTVLSAWVEQLEKHIHHGSLNVYMYYGERTKDVEELQKFDVVLTTYSTLSAENNWAESPVKKMEWWRIVLDEAHVIRNVTTQQSEAVIELEGERRWVVTGTPIQNGTFDLFPLMSFLRFQPFSVKSYWQSLVQLPFKQGKAKGLERLQALMKTISLRRTKDARIGDKSLVGLPPKTIETCFVELSAEERELYDCLESEAKRTIDEYIHSDSLMQNYFTVLHVILRLRQICNCSNLCPSDVRSRFPFCTPEDVSNNPELRDKMASIIQDGDDFDCPICLSPPSDTIITCCAHFFCKGCIYKTILRLNPRCPICRHPLSKSDLFSVPKKPANDDDSTSSAHPVSAKVSKLLELLTMSRGENPSTKCVIFSQFRKMLILLEGPLMAAGFSILRLDGSMTAKKRSQVVKEFGECGPDSPTVLLASLKAAGTGINLTVASRVYLFEPWWNPGVEEQAMDRVHRIGQKEEVKIVRLIVRNSVEERILELQEKKKDLASGAFGKNGSGKGLRKMHVEHLKTILCL